MAAKHAVGWEGGGRGCREEVKKEVEGSLATLKTSLCKPVPLPPARSFRLALACSLPSCTRVHLIATPTETRIDTTHCSGNSPDFPCSFSNFPPRERENHGDDLDGTRSRAERERERETRAASPISRLSNVCRSISLIFSFKTFQISTVPRLERLREYSSNRKHPNFHLGAVREGKAIAIVNSRITRLEG